MDLESLRVVVRLAELGSFTLTATQLALSKSRVSQRVKELEAELGVRLFHRTTRVVRPTPDGEQLVVRARRLVAEADEVAALFQGPRNLRGRVRIDLPTAFARTHALPRLPELLALHPQLEIELSATDRRVDVLREGFDCVLRVGSLREPSLTAQRLGLLAMVNLVSPAYVQRHGVPASLDDLARHYIVHYSQTLEASPPTFDWTDASGRDHEEPLRSLVTVNSIDAYRAACLAGLGIIQTPRYGAVRDLADGTFIEVLPDYPATPMPVALVHAHGRQVPRRVRVVMQWLASMMEPHVMRAGAPRAE